MSNYSKVIEILKLEGLNPQIHVEVFKNTSFELLKWKDANDEHYIFEEDIAINGENIAWFQTSEGDNHVLVILEEGTKKTEIIPKTYNPVFGCLCLLLEWYEKHLIFIYQEKHGIYVCSIKDSVIQDFYFEGEKLEHKGNKLAYETHINQIKNHSYIELIELPSLKPLKPITKDEAVRLGLLPQGLNRPGGFLKDET